MPKFHTRDYDLIGLGWGPTEGVTKAPRVGLICKTSSEPLVLLNCDVPSLRALRFLQGR